MADIYDIKAMDIDDSIMFRVKFKSGARFVPADMDFYFEVLEENVDRVKKFVDDCADRPLVEFVERGWTDVDGRPAVSIKYQRLRDKNSILRIFDNGVDTEVFFFNADIKEEYQWILHHGHEIADFMENPLWLDIEVDPTDIRKKLKSPHAAYRYSNRIYMVGMSKTNGTSYPVIRQDERRLLKEAYAIASAHSCIVGWSSKNFDIPCLQGRSDNLGLKLDWSKIPHIDFMEIHKKYMKFKKELGEVVYNGLDRVSEKFLGYGKTDDHKAYRMLPTWWKNDWLALETYCMNDVYLMIDLYNNVDGLRDATNVEVAKVKMAHLEPNRRYPSAFVDNKLTEMSLARNIGIPKRKEWQHRDKGDICPSCETINEFGAAKCGACGFNLKEEKGEGGWVPKPKLGLDFNTIFVDYYSLYPTIYMTHNIGVNTVDWNKEFDDSIRTEELWFRPESRGLNAEFMEYLLTERNTYRDGRDAYIKGTAEYIHYDMNQEALKTILVAANGVMEEKGFRYKNRAIYDSCTKTGQVYLRYLIEAGALLGLELKQADTDGVHFLSPYETVEETVEHLEEIEKFMYDYVKKKAVEKWGLPEKYYAIYPRCEMVCSHFFSIAKKSYVMRIVYDNGKWTTRFAAKGMPGVKYNTLPLLKVILQGIFKEVIFEIEPGGDYIPACVDYLLKIKDDLYSGRRPDYLTFAQAVKSLEGRLPHNRAGIKLDEMGLFEEGMIIHFIRRANGDIILPDHEEYRIDLGTYNRYWKGAVASWLGRLLPEVASEYELGFNIARPNEKLSWL